MRELKRTSWEGDERGPTTQELQGGGRRLKDPRLQVEEKVGRYHLRKGVEGDTTVRVRGWQRTETWRCHLVEDRARVGGVRGLDSDP